MMTRQWEAAQRGMLSTWTVFDHPRDFPAAFVARRFESGKGTPEPVPTDDIIVAHELEPLHECLARSGLTPLARMEGDQPQIVEVWL
ncbi:hypothetical protein [Bradyrhizobium elkanii]|uniref:hypothetical protein n=1 Tax=Bradyrhizobium elkanii TaxID=29448 RepID=UPI0018AD5DB3|nr:hypothetical protein [Bradyrhizobium elkanii]